MAETPSLEIFFHAVVLIMQNSFHAIGEILDHAGGMTHSSRWTINATTIVARAALYLRQKAFPSPQAFSRGRHAPALPRVAAVVLALRIHQWNNPAMIIGDRLRALREEKNLSQGDIEKRTGLLRCYISRVENGHTVPAIETLEKMARALEIPMYQLFYDGEEPPQVPNLVKRKSSEDIAWGSSGKDARFLNKLRRLLGKANEQDRKFILLMAQKMALR